MKNLISRILIYGDDHLSSKNYGAHINYPQESLWCLKQITALAEEYNPTHIIGLGDFTFGRFHTLEYRLEVEKELNRQFEITKGNRYEIKGNHDSATYGMTEYEYYIKNGMLKPSTNLQIGNVNISMIDSGNYKKTKIIQPEENKINIVMAHDFFKFSDTLIADYGKSIQLDDFEAWFGIDYLICGHIHNYELFSGSIVKGDRAHKCVVNYLGSMPRPSYREGHMDDKGHLVMLEIYDSSDIDYTELEIDLWPLEKSFNLAQKEIDNTKKAEKEERLDISDIVQSLNSHERTVGNPEDIIEALKGIPDKYKKKAIELLKSGQA